MISWVLFKHSQDVNALDDAIHYESEAIAAWRKIVDTAGNVYYHNLMMGVERSHLAGRQEGELAALQIIRGLSTTLSFRL